MRFRRILRRPGAALGLGMAVDGHIGNIGQKLGGAILPLDLLEQFRRRVDETGRIIVRLEFRMIDDRFQKGQVRRHAANAELAQGAIHAADCFHRRRPGCRHLDQKRVVMRVMKAPE